MTNGLLTNKISLCIEIASLNKVKNNIALMLFSIEITNEIKL